MSFSKEIQVIMARQLASCLAMMTWISLENDTALPPMFSACGKGGYNTASYVQLSDFELQFQPAYCHTATK